MEDTVARIVAITNNMLITSLLAEFALRESDPAEFLRTTEASIKNSLDGLPFDGLLKDGETAKHLVLGQIEKTFAAALASLPADEAPLPAHDKP